mmetsp:Transcript_33121/g.30028  ORF Transcript_33121/g.30028 Transcript_33121/m.30028 type:complete len:107 (+) Transcript_33121:1090-1410(+)
MPSKPARMIARLDLKELEPYVDKIIQSESKNYKALVGWFQGYENDNTQLNQIASFLKKNRRAGRCKYVHNSSTIYSLHIDDLKSNWLTKYNLNLDSLTKHTDIKPS